MSDATIEPLDPHFQLSLPAFEGPLDLLLHLIQKHELDILDLPIAFVTERYLQYVSMMERLNLDIAAEYLVMAATLAHIKSKMLLPQEPVDQPDDEPGEEIDPRAELIRRLLEYQKYKAAAEQLGARGVAGRDVFLRGSQAPEASGPPPLASSSLFSLLDAFQKVLGRAQSELAFEITAEGVSIQDRMRQLVDQLRERKELRFEQLFEGIATIYDMVVTFLALLEMAKRRLVQIYQADPAAPIHLRSTVISSEEAEATAAVNSWETPPDADVAEDEGSGTVAESSVEDVIDSAVDSAIESEIESSLESELEVASGLENEPAAEAEPETPTEAEPETPTGAEPETPTGAEPETLTEAGPETLTEAGPEPGGGELAEDTAAVAHPDPARAEEGGTDGTADAEAPVEGPLAGPAEGLDGAEGSGKHSGSAEPPDQDPSP